MRCTGRGMSTRITINGQTIIVEGSNTSVSVVNGKVSVGGKVIAENLSGDVHVKWEGPAANIEVHGDLTCGDVAGSINAGNNVTAHEVRGNVNAGNNVTCGQVGGKVVAGNNVNCRR